MTSEVIPGAGRASGELGKPAVRRDASLATGQGDAPSWTPEQLAFQFWLATPKDEREFKTQLEYANANDVNDSTLWRWKMLPGFSDAVWTLTRSLVKADKLAHVVNAQADLAISGLPFASTQAAQLVLTAMGAMPRAGDVNIDARQLIVRELPGHDANVAD